MKHRINSPGTSRAIEAEKVCIHAGADKILGYGATCALSAVKGEAARILSGLRKMSCDLIDRGMYAEAETVKTIADGLERSSSESGEKQMEFSIKLAGEGLSQWLQVERPTTHTFEEDEGNPGIFH